MTERESRYVQTKEVRGNPRFTMKFPQGGQLENLQMTMVSFFDALCEGPIRKSALLKIYDEGTNNRGQFEGFIDNAGEKVGQIGYGIDSNGDEDPLFELFYDPELLKKAENRQTYGACLINVSQRCKSLCYRFPEEKEGKFDFSFDEDVERELFENVAKSVLSNMSHRMLHVIDRNPLRQVAENLPTGACYKKAFKEEVKDREVLAKLLAKATTKEIAKVLNKKGIRTQYEESIYESFHRLKNRKEIAASGNLDRTEMEEVLIWFFSGKPDEEAPEFAGKYIDIDFIGKGKAAMRGTKVETKKAGSGSQ